MVENLCCYFNPLTRISHYTGLMRNSTEQIVSYENKLRKFFATRWLIFAGSVTFDEIFDKHCIVQFLMAKY